MRTDIDFSKGLVQRADGRIIVQRPTGPWDVWENTPYWDDVQEYLSANPESLVFEPINPELTTEKTAEQEIFISRSYLLQTDWIVIKIAEAEALGHDADALKIKYSLELLNRANARAKINELE